MNITIDNVRSFVTGVDEPVTLEDGTLRPLINFDNAATTPALVQVVDTVSRELMMYGSIGRGFSLKSDYSTKLYGGIREKVLQFTGADPREYTCFFVSNTTDGLNKLASALITDRNDVVLATRMEHHSNDLPWRERCRVVYADVDEQGRLDYKMIEDKLQENEVKYVTVTAASNVTGYITDVHRIAALAHEYGAGIIVDGAQIISHRKFSVLGKTPEENIDFFVFSSHKMYSPFGSGAVIGLTDVLNGHMPEFYGGGIVRLVADNWQKYERAPAVYEAGSANYPGVAGMGKAMDVLREIGFDSIEKHEQTLMRRLIGGLKKFDNMVIYGDTENISDRVGVVSFNISDINSYFLAEALANRGGIGLRRGAFCAHPYVWRLMHIPEDDLRGFVKCRDANTPGMIRVSFGIYNTEEEVDSFLEILEKVSKEAGAAVDETLYKPGY